MIPTADWQKAVIINCVRSIAISKDRDEEDDNGKLRKDRINTWAGMIIGRYITSADIPDHFGPSLG